MLMAIKLWCMVNVRKKSWLCSNKRLLGWPPHPYFALHHMKGTSLPVLTLNVNHVLQNSQLLTEFLGTLGEGILGAKLKFQPEGGPGGKLMECPKRKSFIPLGKRVRSVNVVAIWSLHLDISFMKAEILAPWWCCWVTEIIRNGDHCMIIW